MPQIVSADEPPRSYRPQIVGYVGSMLIFGLLFLWDDPFDHGLPSSFCVGLIVGGLLGLPLVRISQLAEEFTIGLRWPCWTHHLVVMAVVSCVVALLVCAEAVHHKAPSLQAIVLMWLSSVFACAPYAVISSLTRWRLQQRSQRDAHTATRAESQL